MIYVFITAIFFLFSVPSCILFLNVRRKTIRQKFSPIGTITIDQHLLKQTIHLFFLHEHVLSPSSSIRLHLRNRKEAFYIKFRSDEIRKWLGIQENKEKLLHMMQKMTEIQKPIRIKI